MKRIEYDGMVQICVREEVGYEMDQEKKSQLQGESSDMDTLGKKFEDLTPEEMKKIQGSGDVSPEDIGAFTTILTSKNPYTCK